jgi:16S rRNA (guanine966-N2)-methyltransferase
VRIVAGRLRGKKLAEVGAGDAAAHLRPTTDRVRESLFNLLCSGKHGDPITGARVLDLFAGTGALGLEALSRGAAHITFVDDGAAARGLLRENVALCSAQGVSKVYRRNATDLGEVSAAPFDLVFLDPPYGLGLGERALASAVAGGWIAPGALIVWEDSASPLPPSGLTVLDQRRYGGTVVTLLRAEVPDITRGADQSR